MVKVKLEFVNDRGELKNVLFYLDKLTYEVYCKLPYEMMMKYLIDEYHEFCKEKHYERKFISFVEECEKESYDPVVLEEIILDGLLYKAFSVLDKEEKKLILEYFYKEKSKTIIARENNVSEGTIRKRFKKIFLKMRNKISVEEKEEMFRILF